MLAELRARLIGQDDATDKVAALFGSLATPELWPKPVLAAAIVGPTAVGKTTLVRAVARAIGAPLIEFDAAAHTGIELRDRARSAIAADLARPRPGLTPPLRVLLIENCVHADPVGLLWLVGDSPGLYTHASSVPIALSRVLLVLTATTRDAKIDPLTSLDPGVGRHIPADRVVRLAPADAKYVPALVNRLVATAGLAPGQFSTSDDAAAAACFRAEFGYGPVADFVDSAVARLRSAQPPAIRKAIARSERLRSARRSTIRV